MLDGNLDLKEIRIENALIFFTLDLDNCVHCVLKIEGDFFMF